MVCPKLQDDKVNFFIEMNQTLLENGVNHFACATFNQLLGIVSQVGEEICTPLFIARVSHDEWEEITMDSCLKCNNYRIKTGEGEQLVEICHLCHLLQCEPNDVYICRHFERQFDFTLGNESSIAHVNITMMSGCGDDQYFFYKTCNNHHNNNGKDIAALHQEALINLGTFLEETIKQT